MREIENSGVRLRCQDQLFAFNPCTFAIDSPDKSFNVVASHVEIMADGELYEAYFDAYDGLMIIDLRIYLQTLFEPKKFFNEIKGFERTETYKHVTILFEVANKPFDEEDNPDVVLFDESFDVYWGALHNCEVFEPTKKRCIKRWIGYPFTFDVIITSDMIGKNLLVEYGQNVIVIDIDVAGTQRVPLDSLRVATGVVLDTYNVAIFENISCETEGVYLRWIDRYGRLSYWLFKQGNTQSKVSNSTDIYDNIANAFVESNGVVRRASYQREDTISVCAPMADEETRSMLMDITTSPFVDMYLHETDTWLPVRTQAGTYTITDNPLQDFVINIIKPEEDTQNL